MELSLVHNTAIIFSNSLRRNSPKIQQKKSATCRLMTPQNFRYKKVLLNTTNAATVCQQMLKTKASVNNNIKEKESQFVRRGEKQCEDLRVLFCEQSVIIANW
ncbi:conserved hypothetical protein [Trichinella spiralis]|uniref:hypothetical protein n=1 Tax=Trichinella spiralis TaxID=6334 RepID=UPI0001EFD931|nr:conserved hypothetical protein [Trichinella spiralis]